MNHPEPEYCNHCREALLDGRCTNVDCPLSPTPVVEPKPEPRDIAVIYTTIDRLRKRRKFKTLKGAQKFAHRWVGETPEMGGWYAVSGDGWGKIEVDGATLRELFPKAF